MWKNARVLSLLAWVLWMDQTVYTLPAGPGDPTPYHLESAQGQWTQLATTSTRGECEAMRTARMQQAVKAEAARDAGQGPGRRPRYRDQYRYFCSPAVEDVRK